MAIKFKVEVTITKVVDVWLEDEAATPEFQAEWRKGLWDIEGIDDIAKHAARMAATGAEGYNLDGIGLLGVKGKEYTRKPDTEFEIDYDEVEAEILERP